MRSEDVLNDLLFELSMVMATKALFFFQTSRVVVV
jgi:hypothetical protein